MLICRKYPKETIARPCCLCKTRPIIQFDDFTRIVKICCQCTKGFMNADGHYNNSILMRYIVRSKQSIILAILTHWNHQSDK